MSWTANEAMYALKRFGSLPEHEPRWFAGLLCEATGRVQLASSQERFTLVSTAGDAHLYAAINAATSPLCSVYGVQRATPRAKTIAFREIAFHAKRTRIRVVDIVGYVAHQPTREQWLLEQEGRKLVIHAQTLRAEATFMELSRSRPVQLRIIGTWKDDGLHASIAERIVPPWGR